MPSEIPSEIPWSHGLSPELSAQAHEIHGIARAAGLDPFEVVFQMLDAKDVNAIAAYGGFPVRYPSWRFGMDYERLEKGHRFGLSKIYELVINNDPAYAYLVRTNSAMEQKLVMAHVYGHADFFKHNVWFQPTDRHMLERMANHGTRMRQYVDLHGQDEVELFLDRALCLDNLIDPFLPLREHVRGQKGEERRSSQLERARRSLEAVLAPVGAPPPSIAEPRILLPCADVLGYVCEKAELTRWQRDVLRTVRAEAYYFLPQRMTKIMNEGWASLWHSRILTGGVLGVGEVVDFADCHSGATAASGGQLNPYKLGIELYRHAEELGHDIFRLRRVHNDASFIDLLVDEEFARTSELFLFGRNARTGRTEVVERGWEQVKEKLLQELSWAGLPRIELVDDDHAGRGELVLVHHHDGRDIEIAAAGETLKSLAQLWGKSVHFYTREEGQGRRLSSDGKELKVSEAVNESSAKESA